MSALAKTLMAFHTRHVGAQTGGAVWVPEEMYEKLVELARRELKGAAVGEGCKAHGILDCLICARGGSR